ncbi:MAG: hypothetical protein C5B52_10965 [Bacteroidetes bacterium]|nr:MAG: hypothetical protein C5B52_10965 [Bacteroidota bacterium]
MKRIFFSILITFFLGHLAFAQQHISSKVLEIANQNPNSLPILDNNDADFNYKLTNDPWPNESAIILCQKTTFGFDKIGISVGRRIGRNILGLLFAIPTLGMSIYAANASNDTKILVEEKQRKKILLRDKYAIEQYSVLYFRVSTESDAFSAQVIKKDGTVNKVDLADAVSVDDYKTVPSSFRGITEEEISSIYRPTYYKIAIPDLEEGDIIEYGSRVINSQHYFNNPSYKEFDPVYYLCNRELPVAKQIIEVEMEDDKYYIGYKSQKTAADFELRTEKGKRIYRWSDNNRDKITDTRFVNEYVELPAIKFQVIYARNNSREFVWFKDEAEMKRDIDVKELGEKAKEFWYHPGKLQGTGDYNAGLRTSIDNTIGTVYKMLRKRGITDATDDDFVKKTYYTIRSMTMYANWSDFAYAKVFSGLLDEKKIPHEIVITTSNLRTTLPKTAFTQELNWVIKYKNKYYCNPDEHLNPEEIPLDLIGNEAIRISSDDEKMPMQTEFIPGSDTLENTLVSTVKASLDSSKQIMSVERTVEAKGLLKSAMIDDVLSLTPYMEADYKNYDGAGMWDGLSSKQEEKAIEDFAQQKKEWKDEKTKYMKALAENEYGAHLTKFDNFRLIQDGRAYKKKNLIFSEAFAIDELTAKAGDDIVVELPSLVTQQTQVKKEERNRTLPIDVLYPRTLYWTISMPVPIGYEAKGLTSLNKTVSNECGSFISTATVENNVIVLKVKKQYAKKQFDKDQWPKLTEILDEAYNFSQSKIILKKL